VELWAHLQSSGTFSSVARGGATTVCSRNFALFKVRVGLTHGRARQSTTGLAPLSDNPEVRFHRLASPAIDRQDILGTRREGDDEIHFRSQPNVAAW
jgi:hypothetical protein